MSLKYLDGKLATSLRLVRYSERGNILAVISIFFAGWVFACCFIANEDTTLMKGPLVQDISNLPGHISGLYQDEKLNCT